MPTAPAARRQILGGAVRRLREARGITQDALATAADLHFTYLSKIERNLHQPSLAVICRLANALAVDVDDISYIATIYVVGDEVPA